MISTPAYLITGAGGGVGGVSRFVVQRLLADGQPVRAMVHRADAPRALGADTVVGDLTNPVDVASATDGISRMFFNTPAIRAHGVLALPLGQGRTWPIAASDVADVVAAVLVAPQRHLGAVYELTGPATLDLDELSDQYSRALGRTITAVRVPYDQWLDDLARVGLSDHVQQHIATMAKLHREDRYNRSTTDVDKITGRVARTVEDYVRERHDLFGCPLDQCS